MHARTHTHTQDLYAISRQLAAVVVPHEYGLDGPGKLLIGSKICAELLGKLMCDLDSMKVRCAALRCAAPAFTGFRTSQGSGNRRTLTA
jgi:hypothetical protein